MPKCKNCKMIKHGQNKELAKALRERKEITKESFNKMGQDIGISGSALKRMINGENTMVGCQILATSYIKKFKK